MSNDTSKYVANTNSDEGEDRLCFVIALCRYFQKKRIKNSDGNSYDIETFLKEFVKELKIKSTKTNIHAGQIVFFF